MKYIITESSLDIIVEKFLDEMFKTDDLKFIMPLSYDEETDSESEDENHLIFYLGDYDENEEAFGWFGCEYFPDSESYPNCPLVIMYEPYSNDLNDLFGYDGWIEPFKKWMMKNTELEVKSVINPKKITGMDK